MPVVGWSGRDCNRDINMDEELDFSSTAPKPIPKAPVPPAPPAARSPLYNPQVALAFFRGAAKLEEVGGGKTFFVENEKSGGFFSKGERMYLLLEGEIGLMAKGAFVGLIRPGEIFGEMALLAKAPRLATAVAKVACKALALDEKSFQAALQKTPEFALMMMGVMVNRLRQNMARKGAGAVPVPGEVTEKHDVFNKKQLASIADELAPMVIPAGKAIMHTGDIGIFMYIVQEGHVAISMQSKIVERVGPGGVFGEMAMVDNSSRAANATAETDCSLIMVKRTDFLDLVKSKPEFGMSILRTIAERIHALA